MSIQNNQTNQAEVAEDISLIPQATEPISYDSLEKRISDIETFGNSNYASVSYRVERLLAAQDEKIQNLEENYKNLVKYVENLMDEYDEFILYTMNDIASLNKRAFQGVDRAIEIEDKIAKLETNQQSTSSPFDYEMKHVNRLFVLETKLIALELKMKEMEEDVEIDAKYQQPALKRTYTTIAPGIKNCAEHYDRFISRNPV